MTARLKAKSDAYQEKMGAWLGEIMDGRKETTPCQAALVTYPEKMEANPEELKSVAKQQEVHKEEATLEERHVAVGRRRQPKKRTLGDGGSRKKLTSAR
jgi:hypothetical protein